MFLPLLLGPSDTAEAIMRDALRRIERAQTMTVTLLRATEEFPRNDRVRYWFRKGGYFRAEAGPVTDVGNPKQGWTYRADQKIYQIRQPLPSTFSPVLTLGLGVLRGGPPVIGVVRKTVWRNRPTLRIELDGRRMTKETNRFVSIAPKSRLPVRRRAAPDA